MYTARNGSAKKIGTPASISQNSTLKHVLFPGNNKLNNNKIIGNNKTWERNLIVMDSHLRRYFDIGTAERTVKRYHQAEHRKNDQIE